MGTLTDEHDLRRPLVSLHRESFGRGSWDYPRKKSKLPLAIPDAALAPMKQTLLSYSTDLERLSKKTGKMHRHLRECQKQIWEHSLEASSASRRLSDLLCDARFTPQAGARELQNLRRTVAGLSEQYADAKHAATQSSIVARRQRVYFAQQERGADEGALLLKKHPAGDVFLADGIYLQAPEARHQYAAPEACSWDADDDGIEDDEDETGDDDEDDDPQYEPRRGCDGQLGRHALQLPPIGQPPSTSALHLANGCIELDANVIASARSI